MSGSGSAPDGAREVCASCGDPWPCSVARAFYVARDRSVPAAGYVTQEGYGWRADHFAERRLEEPSTAPKSGDGP